MSLSETYFHWLQSCSTISYMFSILPAFNLAFFQRNHKREPCSIHRGGLQRVSCGGEMPNALTHLALALWLKPVCVCCECVFAWHLRNLLVAPNSPAELYCTLTDKLSVNVPRLCRRDAFRCCSKNGLCGLFAVLHPLISPPGFSKALVVPITVTVPHL